MTLCKFSWLTQQLLTRYEHNDDGMKVKKMLGKQEGLIIFFGARYLHFNCTRDKGIWISIYYVYDKEFP